MQFSLTQEKGNCRTEHNASVAYINGKRHCLHESLSVAQQNDVLLINQFMLTLILQGNLGAQVCTKGSLFSSGAVH